MLFFSRVVPALLAASSLVKATAVIRGDGGKGDDKFWGFVDALKQHNLTVAADNYDKVANTKEGGPVVDQIENGGKLTVLVPKNCAFEPDYPKLSAYYLLYSQIWGSIDEGFKSPATLYRRDGAAQSHSVAPSGAGMSGGEGKKRQGGSYQVQVIDQTFTPGSRKRWNSPKIEVSQPVGSANVVDRFSFKDIIVLVIDIVLAIPGKVSDLLCKPLIKGEDGFKEFKEGLEKAGLLDDVDEGKKITIFVPTDESIGHDELSKDVLKNHFFFGKRVFSPLFDKIGKATAASGNELSFSFENNIHYVCCGKSKAMLLRTDVIAGNGVMHIIDKPLKCDW